MVLGLVPVVVVVVVVLLLLLLLSEEDEEVAMMPLFHGVLVVLLALLHTGNHVGDGWICDLLPPAPML